MIYSSTPSFLSRLRHRTQLAAAAAVAVTFAATLSLGQLAAQSGPTPSNPFQLQVSDGTTQVPGSVLVTQQNFGTIDMACSLSMSGGWYDVVYDCDADPTVAPLMPANSAYGVLLSEFFWGNSVAQGTILAENGLDTLPMRESVVNTALKRALYDNFSELSQSAVVDTYEGIDNANAQWQSSLGISVVLQHYTGRKNPLMFSPSANVLHFEAMRQHAMWERVADLVKGLGIVNPGDISQMTAAEKDLAWRTAFFNHAIYTSLIRSGLRLRLAAIHVRGHDVNPDPQPPAELLGMPTKAPKSRLSSPAVITFSEATVPQVEPGGEWMFAATITKIVPPGATLNYRLGGFRPGMQVAIEKTTGGTERTEISARWGDYGVATITLPTTMSYGNHRIVEVRYQIPYPNGNFGWTAWQQLTNQPLIKVATTGQAGNPN